ncbi:Hpt domain-containing protein [uncultured Reyranella sp.]|uniref:Hpt domain-containing protein n=1 Tax=uncultured Reyranella sp. TaxID=735512 RepID=UPI0025D5ABB1|nr:Hpt domain-containing protein [uncultured Reyranella sp.]
MNLAYDRGRLAELFGDDPVTLAEIEREFLDTARGAEREIRDTDDLETIAQAAHRVKGASGMIGANALSQVAAAVEKAAKTHGLTAVRRLEESFSHEVTKVAILMSDSD